MTNVITRQIAMWTPAKIDKPHAECQHNCATERTAQEANCMVALLQLWGINEHIKLY